MKVDSAVMNEVNYNDETNEMTIEFWNGSIFVYKEVPKELYEEFIDSTSIGQFFHRKVKDKFTFRKGE